jgi:hypothetical protein
MDGSSSHSPQPRTLPVFACISHTLNSTFSYGKQAMRIALPWLAIITVINIAVMIAGGGFADGAGTTLTLGTAVRELLLGAISLVAASSIAVNWHRYILRDEMPTSLQQVLRLDAPVWHYAGFTLLNIALVMLPAIILLAINMSLAPAVPIAAIAVFIAGIVLLRLSLVLPAKALGIQDFGLSQAMAASQDNMLQLAGLMLVNAAIIIGVLLGFGLLLMAVMALPAPVNMLLAAVISLAVNAVITIYSVSLLSSLYGFFVERRDF